MGPSGWQHELSAPEGCPGEVAVPWPSGLMACSATTLRRKGWPAADHVGQATSALAFCKLTAYLSSAHCPLLSRSYMTHTNTRLKTTFSYVAWGPAFSMASVMVNLQSARLWEWALISQRFLAGREPRKSPAPSPCAKAGSGLAYSKACKPL